MALAFRMRSIMAGFATMIPVRTPGRPSLDKLKLDPPKIPMIFNRHGQTCSNSNQVRELLSGQLVSPVRWDRVMQRLVDLEITDYVEIGPGKVLRGLVRLNHPDPATRVHNVSDLRSCERTVRSLQN